MNTKLENFKFDFKRQKALPAFPVYCNGCGEKIPTGRDYLKIDSCHSVYRFHVGCFLEQIRLLWNKDETERRKNQ